MSDKRIGALLLDVGNVLLDFDHGLTWRGIGERAGVPWQEVRDFLAGSDLSRGFDLGRITPAELLSRVRQRFHLEISPEGFFRIWADIFTPREDVLALLPSLAARLPLFLLSNTDPVHFEYIERTYPFLNHFSGRILSFEVGARKPEPAIFRAAVRMTGLGADRCLFFDDIEEHVLAARREGIRAHLFTGAEGMIDVLRGCGIE